MNSLKKYYIDILSILLGVILLGSAFLKLVNVADFTQIIVSYGFGILSNLSPLIILLEFILGLHFILLVRVRLVALISVFTLAIFTLIYTYGLIVNGITSCGCFGNLWQEFFDLPLVFYTKNLLLSAISLAIFIKHKNKEDSEIRLKNYIIMLLTAFAIFVAGYTFEPYQSEFSININELEGQSVNELGLDEVYSFSSDSTYIIFLFSYSCPHCLNSICNVNLYKEKEYIDQILFLPVGESNEKQLFDKDYSLSGIRIDDEVELANKICSVYPTTLFVKNKKVTFVKEGLVSSPLVFYRKNILK